MAQLRFYERQPGSHKTIVYRSYKHSSNLRQNNTKVLLAQVSLTGNLTTESSLKPNKDFFIVHVHA